MKLAHLQKTEILNLIEEYGLSKSQFEFEEKPSEHFMNDFITTLKFKDNNYYYLFKHAGERFSKYSPGITVHEVLSHPNNWVQELQIIRQWLSNLINVEQTTKNNEHIG